MLVLWTNIIEKEKRKKKHKTGKHKMNKTVFALVYFDETIFLIKNHFLIE